jgi:transposase
MNITTIGLDLAKNVFQVHGIDECGNVVLQKQLTRAKILVFFAKLAPCLIGMEACSGAHYWARELMARGHTVRLMPAQYVKPYVKGNKNDGNDAAGICEAVTRPHMRFVSINTLAQQDTQMLHRIRERLVAARTALINQLRGLCGEYGVVFSVGPAAVQRGLVKVLGENAPGLSELALELLLDLYQQWQTLDERIAAYDARVVQACRGDDRSQRLDAIPGFGPLTATALVASVGDATQFPNGRQMAANLGLTPREHSSGGKQRLLGISKRGDVYLRTLLIHGARTVLQHAAHKTDRLSRWVMAVQARRGKNVAAVALANKLARIAWAVLARGRAYQADWQERVTAPLAGGA